MWTPSLLLKLKMTVQHHRSQWCSRLSTQMLLTCFGVDRPTVSHYQQNSKRQSWCRHDESISCAMSSEKSNTHIHDSLLSVWSVPPSRTVPSVWIENKRPARFFKHFSSENSTEHPQISLRRKDVGRGSDVWGGPTCPKGRTPAKVTTHRRHQRAWMLPIRGNYVMQTNSLTPTAAELPAWLICLSEEEAKHIVDPRPHENHSGARPPILSSPCKAPVGKAKSRKCK